MARVMIFNGKDWTPLDWDAPATSVTIDRALNAPTLIELEFPAEYMANMHDGFPWVYRDMTHVVVEDDLGNVYGGVVKESPLSGDSAIAAYGHSIYAESAPWRGSRQLWTNLDAVVGFRRVWQHIIDQNNIPRMQLRGSTRGGAQVGKPQDPGHRRLSDRIKQAERFLDKRENKVSHWEKRQRTFARRMFNASGRSAVGEVVTKNSKVELTDAGTNKAVIEYEGESKYNIQAVSFWNWTGVGAGHWVRRGSASILKHARDWIAAEGSRERASKEYPTYEIRAKELREQLEEEYPDGAAEPYEISWWQNRDLSDTLNELADLGGFDWYDTGRWVGDDYYPGIEIVTSQRPVRDDIHLELGINIHEAPDLNPQEVATHVTALGAGEGSATLRAERRMSHSRLIPVHRTVSNKDYRTRQLVERAADAEMDRSRKALTPQLEGLVITDHPLARINSFRLGDRFSVVGTLDNGMELDATVRVVSIEQDLAGNALSVEVEGI